MPILGRPTHPVKPSAVQGVPTMGLRVLQILSFFPSLPLCSSDYQKPRKWLRPNDISLSSARAQWVAGSPCNCSDAESESRSSMDGAPGTAELHPAEKPA